MTRCQSCGHDNEDHSPACGRCGQPLTAPAPAPVRSERTMTDAEPAATPAPPPPLAARGVPVGYSGTLMDADDAPPQPGAEAQTPTPSGFAGLGRQYEIMEQIGAGGMSVVYRARDRKLNRDVALKRLLPQYARRKKAVDRLMAEARSIAALQHPNIVNVFDIDEDAEGPYIAMEYVQGPAGKPQTLADKIKDEGVLKEQAAVSLILMLCQAVGQAHAKGIVHRDIKPSNILMAADGTPKLLDFGIAQVAKETLGDALGGLTMEGASLGTPDYMAPEQEGGAKDVDARTDVYALGGVLSFCLSGYSARYFRESSIPLRLRAAVSKALERERDKRWPNVAAFAEALTGKTFELLPLHVLSSASSAVAQAFGRMKGATGSTGGRLADLQADRASKLVMVGMAALILGALIYAPMPTLLFLLAGCVLLPVHRQLAHPDMDLGAYVVGLVTAVQRGAQQVRQFDAKALLVLILAGALVFASPLIFLGLAGAAAIAAALHTRGLLHKPLTVLLSLADSLTEQVAPLCTRGADWPIPWVILAIVLSVFVTRAVGEVLHMLNWFRWREEFVLPAGLLVAAVLVVFKLARKNSGPVPQRLADGTFLLSTVLLCATLCTVATRMTYSLWLPIVKLQVGWFGLVAAFVPVCGVCRWYQGYTAHPPAGARDGRHLAAGAVGLVVALQAYCILPFMWQYRGYWGSQLGGGGFAGLLIAWFLLTQLLLKLVRALAGRIPEWVVVYVAAALGVQTLFIMVWFGSGGGLILALVPIGLIWTDTVRILDQMRKSAEPAPAAIPQA